MNILTEITIGSEFYDETMPDAVRPTIWMPGTMPDSARCCGAPAGHGAGRSSGTQRGCCTRWCGAPTGRRTGRGSWTRRRTRCGCCTRWCGAPTRRRTGRGSWTRRGCSAISRTTVCRWRSRVWRGTPIWPTQRASFRPCLVTTIRPLHQGAGSQPNQETSPSGGSRQLPVCSPLPQAGHRLRR